MSDSVAPVDAPRWLSLAWLGDLNSFLVSTAVHLVAFVGIGLLSLSAQHGFEQGALVVQLGDGNDAVAGEEGRLEGATDVHESASETDSTVAQSSSDLLTPQAVASHTTDADGSQLVPVQVADAEIFGTAK